MVRYHGKAPSPIDDLFPELTAEEREIAKQNLDDYFNLVLRVFNRLEAEGKKPESSTDQES